MRNWQVALYLGLLVACPLSGQLFSAQTASGKSATGLTLTEAIQSTLENHPVLRAQEVQVEFRRGQQEQFAGQFDSLIEGGVSQNRSHTPLTTLEQQQDEAAGIFGVAEVANVSKSGVSYSRLFRSGISVSSGMQLRRNIDNITGIGGINTSTAGLLISIPLLRGRGAKAVAAQENAARTEVRATLYDFNQLIAQLMLNTATSYWKLVAARKNVDITRAAETRAQSYLDNVRELVAADHVPRNDLNEVMANQAQATSNRIAAEQQRIAAEAQLALDMGRDGAQVLGGLASPADDFPNAGDGPLLYANAAEVQYYFEQALDNRADYLAARARVSEQHILTVSARNGLLPQINLNVGSGYSGLEEGRRAGSFFTSTFSGVTAPDATAGITYTFPGSNQTAKGLLRQANATERQAELQKDDLERTIGAQVAVAVQSVRNAVLQVEKARESVASFELALSGEREKYRGGIGSIVDILTVEDKLTNAMAAQVQTELGYALALAQFRFSTGTLAAGGRATQNISGDIFFTLPFTGPPQMKP